MHRTPILILAFLTAGVTAYAQHEHHHHGKENRANQHMHQRPVEELVRHFESPERKAWQKPDEVVETLGPLAGKTVMDIGAGSGYFTFRMAERGARVIAADVDDRFQDYIRQEMERRGQSGIETRLIPHNAPGLAPEEADLVLLVNTYHHIEDRIAYFRQVYAGIKPGGQLVIVDFIKEETPVGPPVDHRLSEQEVIEEIRAAGFKNPLIDRETLAYQYLITFHR